MDFNPALARSNTLFGQSLWLSLLLHGALVLYLLINPTDKPVSLPGTSPSRLSLTLKNPLQLLPIHPVSAHKPQSKSPETTAIDGNSAHQADSNTDRIDLLSLIQSIPEPKQDPDYGGRTDTGAIVMNRDLLKRLEQAKRSTAINDTGPERDRLSSYDAGAWMDMVKIDNRCFQILRENPLDPISREKWYRVKCKN